MHTLATDRRVCDRYTLLEHIGSGGHSEIWRARDARDGVDVALKILHPALAGSPEAWAVLQREYLMTQRLDHPGILVTQAPVRDGELVLLPMEYASGGDLRRLRAQSYLRIVPVLIEIATALEHAHERGVVHRDLKPGNVLFDARGKLRLADFGAADFAGSSAALAAGSPFSASPQQLRNEPAAPADDIYGLGALAYELLSGYPPFYPDFNLERVLKEAPPRLAPAQTAPDRLIELVESMLAKLAVARPKSMGQIIEDLYQSLSDTLELDEDEDANGAAQGFALTRVTPAAAPATATVSEPPPSPRPRPPPPQPPAALTDGSTLTVEPAPVRAVASDSLRGARRRITSTGLRGRGWLAFAALALVVLAAILALPRLVADRASIGPVTARAPDSTQQNAPVTGGAIVAAADSSPLADAVPATEESAAQARTEFQAALATLEAQQAGAWAGESFAAARAQGETAQQELDAGRFAQAQDRYRAAARLLAPIAGGRDAALQRELAAGTQALQAGQGVAARQAFERAARIQADNAAVRQGLRDARELDTALQRVADGARAQSSGNTAQALRQYEQAVESAPQFHAAREARDRLRESIARDEYERAVATGFDALRGERYAAARTAFKRALVLRGDSDTARSGLSQVDAALAAQDFGALRQRAAGLEAAERWQEALANYERVLGMDPGLSFARLGRDRAMERLALSQQLDHFIAEPQRLAAEAVHREADVALQRAALIDAPGAVLRSQIARVEILLEDFQRPVRLALESDNSTQISIARVGSLGAFARRDLTLKPGRYTVIGTRAGFRDVRRDVTLVPGQNGTVVSVQCNEPI